MADTEFRCHIRQAVEFRLSVVWKCLVESFDGRIGCVIPPSRLLQIVDEQFRPGEAPAGMEVGYLVRHDQRT